MNFLINIDLSLYYLLIFIVIVFTFYFQTRIKNPLSIKIEENKIYKDFKVTHIYGFNFSYGVGIDKYENIFIPDFKTGLIYKIFSKLNRVNIYKLEKKSLKKLSFFEKLITFTHLKKIISFSSNIYKPHEIYFDEFENTYITQMGLGDCKGKGRVSVFSKNNELIDEIGLSSRDNIGLIDPVMTQLIENFLYISESGANKILRYKKHKLIDWIGDDKDQYIDQFTNKKNLFIPIKLDKPHAIKLGPDDNYYIVDTSNHRIVRFSKKGEFLGWIGKTDNGEINDNWEKSGKSISGSELGAFNTPIDLIFFNNLMLISDCFNARLIKVSVSGKSQGWLGETLDLEEKKNIWKIGKNPTPSKSLTGFNRPFGIKLYKDKLYIADKQNFRVKIIESKSLL
tara:strand:- start:250 stop:1437 length:1188 start_codon:yes stop_codon:yes gene_type:complete